MPNTPSPSPIPQDEVLTAGTVAYAIDYLNAWGLNSVEARKQWETIKAGLKAAEQSAKHNWDGWQQEIARAEEAESHRSSPSAEWRGIDDDAKSGKPILADFGPMGVWRVTWEEAINGLTIWCVDDNKHGPYALRGYSDPYPTRYMPLPEPPK